MTLRKKAIIMTCVVFAASIAIMFVISQTIMMRRFDQLEKDNTSQNTQRVVSALYRDFSTINITFSNLMVESQCFSYVQDESGMYMKINISEPAFATMGLNYILFAMSGLPPTGMGYDLLTGQPLLSFPTGLTAELMGDSPLSTNPQEDSTSITGILVLPENTLLVQSYPIVVNSSFGLIEGRVIFVRFLDDTEVQRLAGQTHLSLSLYRLNDPQMPADFLTAQPLLSDEAPVITQPLSSDTVAGYGLLNDVYGNPAMILRADMSRDIYRQGQQTVIWLMVYLAAASLAFGIITILLMNKVLLSRVFGLSAGVDKVRRTGNLSERVSAKGNDELSSLGAAINGMLASLEQSQHELTESEAKNRALVNAIPDIMFRLNKNGTLMDARLANENDLTRGKPETSKVNKASPQYKALSTEVVQRALPHMKQALETGETQIFEFHLPLNGNSADYEARIAVSGNDEALVMVRDVTERKQAEEAHKKDLLLREIHHRVKNNLQVISSLLYLQSRRVDDQNVVEMFNESSNRVKSMTLIHQKLYQSKDTATINFGEYIRDLIDALFLSYGVDRQTIALKLNIENAVLSIDTAIPCGLIINEIISNSLKYAFPEGRQGQISVTLQRENGTKFILVVGDNGVSLPKDLDFRNTTSLGLKLVTTLVEQLGGTIELNQQGGTEFTITFREQRQ